jgi:hypothetical protein
LVTKTVLLAGVVASKNGFGPFGVDILYAEEHNAYILWLGAFVDDFEDDLAGLLILAGNGEAGIRTGDGYA